MSNKNSNYHLVPVIILNDWLLPLFDLVVAFVRAINRSGRAFITHKAYLVEES